VAADEASLAGAKRRSKEELEQAVAHVFANFGTQFKMEF
jgi:hypothetical protein